MNELILLGAGGHTRACIDVIELEGKFKIAGLVNKSGNDEYVDYGYPILGNDSDLGALRKKYKYAFVSIGQIKTPEPRMHLFKCINEYGYSTPVIVSPKAYVSKTAEIGPGSIIMHGAVVNAHARIGDNCIVNNLALIEHDTVIHNHCHISTSAVLNGGVEVNEGTFVGSGTVIKQGVQISKGSIIAMGMIVKEDVEHGQVIVGYSK
jgi:sugar O-acyltransferase (sialic acid O-acetyltransferase NeuD family)